MDRDTSGTQRNLEAESSSATLQLNPAEPIKTHQIPPLVAPKGSTHLALLESPFTNFFGKKLKTLGICDRICVRIMVSNFM